MDVKPVDCLLDTGIEVTMIPGHLARKLPKHLVASQVRAANGTLIEALGLVRLQVSLQGREMIVERVASDHIAEVLLGIDWLEAQAAVWDMGKGQLFMHGRVFSMRPKLDEGWVRRVIVQEFVQLPARCEVNVARCTVFNDLSSTWEAWASKPGSPTGELHIAHALVLVRCSDVWMQVMNLPNHSVTLAEGTGFADLEAVQTVENPEARSETLHDAVAADLEDLEALPKYAIELDIGVDPAVLSEAKWALLGLLLRYPVAFSKRKDDLGRAVAVQHRIETGDNRPFRQVLRRHPTALLHAIDSQVESILRADLFKPAQSEWVWNVVMVRKSDGSWRFCIDYRLLNARKVKDAYPLSRDRCVFRRSGWGHMVLGV